MANEQYHSVGNNILQKKNYDRCFLFKKLENLKNQETGFNFLLETTR